MDKCYWTPEGSINIPCSKAKVLLVFFGAAFFVLGSLFVLVQILLEGISSSIFMLLICLIAILFFGAIAISSLSKLLTSSTFGLKIDSRGVEDRSSGVRAGRLAWKQINDYRLIQVQSTRFILLDVNNPKAIIQQSSGINKLLLSANFKRYGTPVSISVAGLDCDFKFLEQTIEEAFQRYK